MHSLAPNKPLFSQHYLDYRLQDSPEWQQEVGDGFERLQRLYLAKKAILPTLNEAQTEAVFIQPVLDILGFSSIPQVTTTAKGRAERPDYALFSSESDRDNAYRVQNEETAFYHRVLAIAEAKYWQRSLSDVSRDDRKDIYKNTNPSFQITNYLTGTGVDWGILTNGREWRLYYRQASSTATEFYPIDLVELLEREDLEAFKYFWLFFRQEAFVKDVHGKNFLERVREGSTTYAVRVGNELKALVFDRVFPEIAQGFVNNSAEILPERVYLASLSFLYKLLFLLYAEARNLLPMEGDYRDYSLLKKTQEITEKIDKQNAWSSTSTQLYDALLGLFRIVDKGDPNLSVPRYNGGLFNMSGGEVNNFLTRYKLSDAILAPVLDKLARFEGNPIDYSFLGVRQLGSIYEGLLEYRLARAGNSIHLENDKGERKATGSYYTPDYIVKYIISHTLKPILAEREKRFGELMEQISNLYKQREDKRLGNQSQQGLQRDLRQLEKEAQSTLLDIKICDPAMGSGHFLVEAIDFLTDELIQILNRYPEYNPVLTMLEATRQSILENLQSQGITLNPNTLEPTQLLQRVVMKRCIYGVDLNPMAVELAKVSLWLHSFTIGAPLSFLDHHLRCGNSLIGTTAREAEASMIQEEGGQLNFLTGPFVGLLRAAEIMRGISTLSDATFAEVETSEKLFRDFDTEAKPYKRLLDVFVSQYFGMKTAKEFLQRYGNNITGLNWDKLPKSDREILVEAEKLYKSKRFFHWDLEFPEVFIDLDSASWLDNAGFDAVVGNPPYVRSIKLKETDLQTWSYYSQIYQSAEKREFDIYLCFVEKGLKFLNNLGHLGVIIPNKWFTTRVGESLRQILSESKTIESIVDFRSFQVFDNVTTYTCLLFLNRKSSESVKIASLENDLLDNSHPLPNTDDNNWIIENIKNTDLNSESWNFKIGSSGLVLSKLEKLEKLSKIAYIFKGTGTSADSVFMMKYDNNKFYSRSLESWIEIEEELMKPSLTGRDIDCYDYDQENYILFPYILQNNQFKIIKADELSNKYPKTWSYLNNKINQNSLKKRDKNSFVNRNDWYAYGRPQNHNLLGSRKIVFPDVANKGKFTYDAEGRYIIDTSYGILLKENLSLSLLTLTTILNSSVMTFFLKETGTDLRGGYFRMKTAYLNPFPIPKITFTTPIEHRQKSLENLITLYKQNQPILNQIQTHIDQEETDIIHDILAYLAQQMIELNTRKQTEIKNLLKYLERLINCPIDTLTNKSKIQNYLGDYQKSQPHLTLVNLLEILQKNQRKISLDLTTRKTQETLEREYQGSLEILFPIKKQLTDCDKIIDAIVYKLYGLTEEEITIIEGRN